MTDDLIAKIEANKQKAMAKKRQREEMERQQIALEKEQEQIMDEYMVDTVYNDDV